MPPKEDAGEKRKAEDEEKKDEPPAKEAKVVETPKAAEADAPEDKRPAIKETIAFDPSDITMNVIPTMGGKMLMTLTEGGMQYLVAAARANVGVKSGRYMFEVRMVESLSSQMQPGAGRSPNLVKHLVRVGFSLGGSSVFLGGTGDNVEDSICFDSEGFFIAPGQKKKEIGGQKFGKDNVMAVVLNLDADATNGNTITLFKDGVAASKPLKIHESLLGKPLFPHVAFRNASLHVNFGPAPLVPLPFKCRTLQTAASADVQVTPSSTPKDGKFDVVFPVGVPDEGTFPWLEAFLAKNPQYTELSDRMIVEWAQKSGVWRPNKGSSWKSSNDKPEFNFGIAALDDLSARKVIQVAAPLVPRHYVVMEIRGNLMPQVRKETLKRFKAAHYRRTAKVVFGEPDTEYREKVLSLALKQKQEKVNAEWKSKKAELKRKKDIAIRQKQLAEARKAADEAAAKKKAEAEEKKKKAAEEAAAKKKEEEEKAKEGEEQTEEQKAEEEAKKAEEAKQKEEEEKKAEEEKKKAEEEKKKAEEEAKKKEDEEKDDDDMGDEPPQATLDDEEKKVFFPKRELDDLTAAGLATGLAQFSAPSADEGFDQIEYVWSKDKEAKEYLRSWVCERKVTVRVDDLQPSQWFKDKNDDWQKVLQNWQIVQKDFKSDPAKMASAKVRDDKLKAKEKGEEAKEEEPKEGEEEKKEEEGEAAPEDFLPAGGSIEVAGVKNIDDIGNGEPLYLHFAFEDWSLVSLRFEMHVLAGAFLHDTGDPERVGIHESHLAFYYQKYFKKALTPKFYGAETIPALLDMVKDTVTLDPKLNVMMAQIKEGEDIAINDQFMKLTEEARRARQSRLDSGDETARLKFNVMAGAIPAKGEDGKPKAVAKSDGGWGSGKSSYGKGGGGKGGSWGGSYGGGGGNWGGKGGKRQW